MYGQALNLVMFYISNLLQSSIRSCQVIGQLVTYLLTHGLKLIILNVGVGGILCYWFYSSNLSQITSFFTKSNWL